MDKDIFTYELSGKLYVNLTNQCSNNCTFCLRSSGDSYEGYHLRLSHEPSAEEVLKAIDNPKKYQEIVFCGYGEPMCRFDTLIQIAEKLKPHGVPIRVNTNGQASLIEGKDVSSELAKYVDIVSISLNAVTAEKYQALCNSRFGVKSFDALLGFAKKCKTAGMRVIFSVVEAVFPQEDLPQAEAIARECGAELRLRKKI